MKVLSPVLIMFAVTLAMSGCSAKGSYYKPADTISSEKTMVIFYRPKNFIGCAARSKILDNGKEIGKIQNGQFIQYLIEAGRHNFQIKHFWKIFEGVEFEAEEGKFIMYALTLVTGTV